MSFGQLKIKIDAEQEFKQEFSKTQNSSSALPHLFNENNRFVSKLGFGFINPKICLFVLDRFVVDKSDLMRS